MNYNNFTSNNNDTRANVERMILSDSNVNKLVRDIIELADPLRNTTTSSKISDIKDQVVKLLSSWKDIGKFERGSISVDGRMRAIYTIPVSGLLSYYNHEFIRIFADSIYPNSKTTSVVSVPNPNGLYAQQNRVIKETCKPIPFYERALYKRHHDTTLDIRIDETEVPFYKWDHNPRLSSSDRKKRHSDTTQWSSYLDRTNMIFRSKPNY